MPHVGKEALSQFIRTECLRQLRLNLSPNNHDFQNERTVAGMPPVQPPRPGLEHLAQAGEEWQAEKIADLSDTFGAPIVVGNRHMAQNGNETFGQIELINFLSTAPLGCFIVEAGFEVGTAFENALGITNHRQTYGLSYARLRPDIIEVFSAGTDIDRYIRPDGTIVWLPDNDQRVKLRIIDIKLTAEPSPSYFAEVAYYSMALAGWLIDKGLDNLYVVVPNAAIWPGSHDASSLVRTHREIEDQGGTPTYDQLWYALQDDLEPVPFEVFVGRVRRFFFSDVPQALSVPWQQHPLHVNNRCKGCDYLGYPWFDRNGQPTANPLHCIPTAEQTNHLSRIAFMSRGASAALNDQGISDVPALTYLQPNSTVFNEHYILRATRNVISSRAASLQSQQALIPSQGGTSGVMPKYADLHIYLTVDFDLGSAITFAMGVKGFWLEPQPYGFVGQRDMRVYGPHIHVVDQKDLNVERRELMAFLYEINEILTDAMTRNRDTTVQFYIWDSVQYKHLTRIIGRHLQTILADRSIQHLAWLFPAEEILPNPVLETRRSPITIVRDVIRTLLAAPIPHYYTLFQTARAYHKASLPPQVAAFSVHPLFEDILSDQIPSERAHEIWARVTHSRRPWLDQLQILQETLTKQLNANEAITRKLEEDLRQSLQQIAPKINIEPPRRQSGISFDGQLWYGFARLNAALGELEVHQIRAMPPEEREARYRSARLRHRLSGQAETHALTLLGIAQRPGLRVYEMRSESREVKMREGDFNFSLAPENMPGFLDRRLQNVTQGTPLEPPDGSGWHTYMETVTAVIIVAIDRDTGLIAVVPNNRYPTMLDDLERHGLADFSHDLILDPAWIDAYTRKLHNTLHAIGNPLNARNNPLVRRAVGLTTRPRGRQTSGSPAADLLWSSNMLANFMVQRNLTGIQQLLEQGGVFLNQSQWTAWGFSLSHRLQLIWGPPGTGKSRTLRAVALGAIIDAVQRNVPLRLLICAPTYNALDTVLLETVSTIGRIVQHPDLQCMRMRSSYHPSDQNIPTTLDLELNKANTSQAVRQLRRRLQSRTGVTIVGATAEQTHNLLIIDGESPLQEFFDFIILDEASQVDVGHAILPFAALASDGVIVVAGDPMQLPPIHQAKPPVGLEAMVGSIYSYFEAIHQVLPAMLAESYRSNNTIVELAHEAGYDRSLTSYSPDMRINILIPFPNSSPVGWPQGLFWSPEWTSLLDPGSPTCCFVYQEGKSSQMNPFEADSVAALVYLLYGRLGDNLLNERNPLTGTTIPASTTAYAMDDFWKKGIGIVTPHRAQQALIVAKLQQVFGPLGVPNQLIRDAVDTVERFQGQQRDVIIASYAMGDQDAINDEDEFLMSLNRFNVMTSRARAKLIVLIAEEVVNHLSNEVEVLRQSRLLKVFVESFCNNSRSMSLGRISPSGVIQVNGLFKWRQ